jgi:hypothetical protein
MEEFNIYVHRVFVDTFFESFYINVEKRESIEEKIEYINFNIQILKQKYNQYLDGLKPDLYTDHRLYVDEIIMLVLKLQDEKNNLKNSNSELTVYKWEIDEDKLKLLYEKLMDNFISSETTFETFKFLFSGRPINEAKEKIVWLKISRNKYPNKKSITDFIDVLIEKNIISIPNPIQKSEKILILNTLFSSKDRELKFTNSNFTTSGKTSEFRWELERLINTLL